MSQENLDTVRRGYEAFTQGDMDAILEIVHPEVEVHALIDAFQGREGFVTYAQTPNFDDFQVDPEEFTDAGDKVLVAVRVAGRGKSSGVDVAMRNFHVCTLRDGKLVRLDVYASKDEALEAVGLQE